MTKRYPIVYLDGSMQSGKTTLARGTLKELPYVTLDHVGNQKRAFNDPRRFLLGLDRGAILDGLQWNLELIDVLIDLVRRGKTRGPFVLSKSSAGPRWEVADGLPRLTLLPLSLAEVQAEWKPKLPLAEFLFRGLYPAVADRGEDPASYYEQLIRLHRSAAPYVAYGRTDARLFLRALARRAGELLNYAAVGRDLGVSHTTVRTLIRFARKSHLIHLLPASSMTFGKRLTKTPKLYFWDTGLLCHLLDIASPEELEQHPFRQTVFESWVISELRKYRIHGLTQDSFTFWRDRAGHEVKLIMQRNGAVYPLDMTYGAPPRRSPAPGLDWWREMIGRPRLRSAQFHGSDGLRGALKGLMFVRWRALPFRTRFHFEGTPLTSTD